MEGFLAKSPVGSQEELINREKSQYHFHSFLALSNPTEFVYDNETHIQYLPKSSYYIYIFDLLIFIINYNIHAPNSIDHELEAISASLI